MMKLFCSTHDISRVFLNFSAKLPSVMMACLSELDSMNQGVKDLYVITLRKGFSL